MKDASARFDMTLMGICHHSLRTRKRTKEGVILVVRSGRSGRTACLTCVSSVTAPITSVKLAPTPILTSRLTGNASGRFLHWKY